MQYPKETVRALLATELVTATTRDALLERLLPAPICPTFFSAFEMGALRAVCDQLLPQPERPEAARINVAAVIDQRLAAGESDGWRYDALPADGEAYRAGLAWLETTAERMGAPSFVAASPAQQRQLLTAAQHGDATTTFAVARWFEELLAEATEAYYAHPVAQEEIGYVGMADVPGWTRIGLNELEPREPEAEA